jgi:Ca2+-binding RTX toxin-like protein
LPFNVENLILTGTGAINGIGNTLANNITGNGSANSLFGGNGNDIISASGGNDTIGGGAGNDTLTGGTGADTFAFVAALGAGNVDRITDFRIVDDTIMLENFFFPALSRTGILPVNAFVIAPSAQDPSDRIIYDSSNGALYYDLDGAGGQVQIRFATLNPNLALTNADFLIV